MARKREGFVPIGDLVIDLPGVPVPARRAAAPKARHHFTQLDQVMQLVGASEADADVGFMARLLALCSPAAPQPRQPERVRPAQRPVRLSHECGRTQ